LAVFYLPVSRYLQIQLFNWASVPGGRLSNPPTTPSTARSVEICLRPQTRNTKLLEVC